MTSTMRASETTGILTTQGQIQLDHPLPQDKPSRVRVILLMAEAAEAENFEEQTSRLPRRSPPPPQIPAPISATALKADEKCFVCRS